MSDADSTLSKPEPQGRWILPASLETRREWVKQAVCDLHELMASLDEHGLVVTTAQNLATGLYQRFKNGIDPAKGIRRQHGPTYLPVACKLADRSIVTKPCDPWALLEDDKRLLADLCERAWLLLKPLSNGECQSDTASSLRKLANDLAIFLGLKIEQQDTNSNKSTGTTKMPPRAQRAWNQYQQACTAKNQEELTDSEAYNLITEAYKLEATRSGKPFEFTSFATWQRSLRLARAALGQQKRSPRSGRYNNAHSVVKQSEL